MKTVRSFVAGAWLIALLLGVWELLSRGRILDPLFFPAPSTLLITLVSLTRGGILGRQVMYTVERTSAGFALGLVCGVVSSAVISLFATLRRAAEPLIWVLYAVPRLTLLPMVMLLVGVNDASRILLIALGTALLMMIQIGDAVRTVNRDYVDMAVNYGASRLTVIRKVYLPACLPQIFTAMRISFSRALVLTISVELLSSDNGLGNMIWNAWQTFAVEKLYVSVALAGALGLLVQGFFILLEKRLVPWKDGVA